MLLLTLNSVHVTTDIRCPRHLEFTFQLTGCWAQSQWDLILFSQPFLWNTISTLLLSSYFKTFYTFFPFIIVGTLMFFHFNVFKNFNMLSQCLVPSITKKLFLTRWFWDSNHLQPFKYKIFITVFQCILKLKKNFLIQNYFYSNVKNYK